MTNTEQELMTAEVLRRVGRNLVIFQQIERFLKILLANHQRSGTPENFEERHLRRETDLSHKTLGTLVGAYTSEVLRDAGEPIKEDDELVAPWFTFTFQVSGDTAFVAEMTQNLKLMTDARNELVHCFLPRWQPGEPEIMKATLAYLDAQRDEIKPMFDHLRDVIAQMNSTTTLARTIMESPAFDAQMELMWIQSSPLVSLLSKAANELQRADGWTRLGDAGRVAARELPEEVAGIKEIYGHRTLKKLLVASELFDVVDNPLPNGHFQTFFRQRTNELSESNRDKADK